MQGRLKVAIRTLTDKHAREVRETTRKIMWKVSKPLMTLKKPSIRGQNFKMPGSEHTQLEAVLELS